MLLALQSVAFAAVASAAVHRRGHKAATTHSRPRRTPSRVRSGHSSSRTQKHPVVEVPQAPAGSPLTPTTTTPSSSTPTTTAATTTTPTTPTSTPAPSGPAPLVFGIYPGGSAGGDSGSNRDNLSDDVAAVRQLEDPGSPFAVHLYAEYYGPGMWSASDEIGQEVIDFARAGVKVELVLCYRPTDMNPSVDVPGFVSWTQRALQQLGPDLSYLQVTNEANVGGDSSANDGSFPGAETALIDGVEAAKQAVIATGEDIKVGFNWAYDLSLGENAFWSFLQTTGGTTFANAVDWVGLDVYPGTWGPGLPAGPSFGDAVSSEMTQALHTLRTVYMPMARLSAGVPIHVSETGFPTGPTRSYAEQATALESEVDAVNAVRTLYNVTDFRWFDLRDAITDSTDFNDQYGLMTDSYTPKPAFTDYKQLIAQIDR
ncbi:MAG: hypothetical protein ACLP50_08675 [Solirubrobacteraceae bacterium]